MFTFHTDPGHGWLEVSLDDMRAVNVRPEHFSRYSYRKGTTFYLEEDCDAPRFVEAYKAKHGTAPQFREAHLERTFIRNLRPNA